MAGGSLTDGRRSQKATSLVEHRLLDDLVRSGQDRLRDREPQRLRGLEIDDQLELRGLLHREIGGLGSFQNLVHEGGGAAGHLGNNWAGAAVPTEIPVVPAAPHTWHGHLLRYI